MSAPVFAAGCSGEAAEGWGICLVLFLSFQSNAVDLDQGLKRCAKILKLALLTAACVLSHLDVDDPQGIAKYKYVSDKILTFT